MKKIILKGISASVSFFQPEVVKSTYRNLSKIKVFDKSINDVINFFIPEKVRLNGQYLFLNQQDSVVSGAIALGVYERFETEVFLKALKPDMTLVDIGANIGYYTLLAAPKVKSVLAFEPDPVSFSLLAKNMAENNCANVRRYQLAVSDKEGDVTLFQNPDNSADSRIYPFIEGVPRSRVSSVALDRFIESLDLTRIDFIKIDIEGAEGHALAGMKKILEQPGLQLMIEFFPYRLRLSGFDPVGILELLANKKFEIYHIDGDRRRLNQITDFQAFTDKFKKPDYVNLYCKNES